MKKIAFIHLWNNFSGSPNVLGTVAKALYDRGYRTTLISSFNNDGFLSDVKSNEKINIPYRFEQNVVLRFFQLMKFQIISSVEVMKLNKNTLIYINTILPFLPALVAKIRRMSVIYHIHEAYPKKGIFNSFCFSIVEYTANNIICVSDYVRSKLSHKSKDKAFVVFNFLSETFISKVVQRKKHDKKTVLMISSARKYKGIFEFCEIAKQIPEYQFTLICDTDSSGINQLFSEYNNIANLSIIPTVKDLHPYYASSDLIVNFSNPQLIIETFGLTILEGMYYGLPSIVPPVGGIADLVEDGVNGYKIDINNLTQIKQGIKKMFENQSHYEKMSENAILKSKEFNGLKQIEKIENLINS